MMCVRKTPPRYRDVPSKKRELTGLALLGEMLGQVNTLDRCDHDADIARKLCTNKRTHLLVPTHTEKQN
jgi:hypothetical protein